MRRGGRKGERELALLPYQRLKYKDHHCTSNLGYEDHQNYYKELDTDERRWQQKRAKVKSLHNIITTTCIKVVHLLVCVY